MQTDATFGIITVGGCDPAVREAVDRARPSAASSPTTCASAASRSARAWRSSSPRTIASSSSSRTATPSCASLLTLETERAEGEAALDPGLRRLPAVEPTRGRRRHQPAGAELSQHADAETSRRPPAACSPTSSASPLRDYEGAMSTLCAGCGHDSVTAAIVRSFYELDTPPHMIAKLSRHRLLVEDADLLRQRRARLQLGARAHAVHRDRRQRRQPRADLHRHLGRRRLAVDRPRPAVPRHPPQPRHGLRHREQRRLRPDQGAVLGVGRRRLEEQARRGEPARAHRSRACWRSSLGRDVRGAQLLGRQGAAGADPEGGAVAPRASR